MAIFRFMFTLERNRVSFSEGHSSGAIPMGVELDTKLVVRDRPAARQNDPVPGPIKLRKYTPNDDWVHANCLSGFISVQTGRQNENAREVLSAPAAARLEMRLSPDGAWGLDRDMLMIRQQSHEILRVGFANLLPSQVSV